MKKIQIFQTMLAIVLAAAYTGYANEIPSLVVEDGDNSVSFAVTNASAVPLRGLRATVAVEEVPSGIDVGRAEERLDIGFGSEPLYRITIPIRVEAGLPSTTFELPVQLTDEEGHTWGFRLLTSVGGTPLPTSYLLNQNAPNPFNPSTRIKYILAGEQLEQTRLEIYNGVGQKVRTLVDELQGAGSYSIVWDSRDAQGHKVSAGVFFYRLESGQFFQTKKMVLAQ